MRNGLGQLNASRLGPFPRIALGAIKYMPEEDKMGHM
jgi:hypothetical protein